MIDASLLLPNLMAFLAQLTVLLAAGLALPRILGLRLRPRLLFDQCLLGACILLPLIEPWQRPAPLSMPVAVAPRPAASAEQAPPPFDFQPVAFPVLACGFLVRLGWLAAGFIRLSRYRRSAIPLASLPDPVLLAQARTGASARWLVAGAVTGPVTFGFTDPVVLLPPRFHAMDPAAQSAIATHELLHIRRADWFAGVLEELIAAALWFHPLVWWLQQRIRLTREEVVDREAVRLTASVDSYVSALLESASASIPDLAPAPTFFFRRGLARRIRSLYQEVPAMSPVRLFASCSLAVAALAVAVSLTAVRFPLMAAPQLNDRGVARVDDRTRSDLEYQHPVTYPMAARRDHVEGLVTLEAVVNPDGTVADARVIDGPEPLRRAALEAVLQWLFVNEQKVRRTVQTTIDFHLASAPATVSSAARPAFRRIGAIHVSPESGRARQALEARLEPYRDQMASTEIIHEIGRIVQPFGLSVAMATHPQDGDGAVTLEIGPAAAPGSEEPAAATRIRVGGNRQATKLRNKVPPVYPPLARAAAIQGSVQFTVTLAADGSVKGIQLISGHPLLVQAAQEALTQWTYEPTYLNGNPVEVITRVDVNFTLSK
ncbi:MAG: M56 family metallopeptidase [Bryobacteraceae bacterium]